MLDNTLLVGFIPPAHINTGSNEHFIMLFGLCLAGMSLPAGLLVYQYKKPPLSLPMTINTNPDYDQPRVSNTQQPRKVAMK